MVLKILTVLVFLFSTTVTIRAATTLLNKNSVLTPHGQWVLGVSSCLMLVSYLQLFKVFDFWFYIMH